MSLIVSRVLHKGHITECAACSLVLLRFNVGGISACIFLFFRHQELLLFSQRERTMLPIPIPPDSVTKLARVGWITFTSPLLCVPMSSTHLCISVANKRVSALIWNR